MGKRGNLGRVSLTPPVSVREAEAHPEYVGLTKRTPKAQVYERVLEAGWRSIKQHRARAEEFAAYAEAGQDAEHRAVVRALARDAREDGVI